MNLKTIELKVMGLSTAKLSTLLVPAMLGALLLTACDKGGDATKAATDAAMEAAGTVKDDATADAVPAVTPDAVEPAPAAESTAGGGGYEPTPEERVPGETRPVEAAPAN